MVKRSREIAIRKLHLDVTTMQVVRIAIESNKTHSQNNVYADVELVQNDANTQVKCRNVTSADSQSLMILRMSLSRSGAQPWAWSPLRAARKQPSPWETIGLPLSSVCGAGGVEKRNRRHGKSGF